MTCSFPSPTNSFISFFVSSISLVSLKTDSIFLEVLSDIHWGHRGFDASRYEQAVNRIAKNKNRFTLFLGDQIDAINIYDKRFNPDTVVEHDIDNQTMGFNKASQPLFNIQEKMKEGSYPNCMNMETMNIMSKV